MTGDTAREGQKPKDTLKDTLGAQLLEASPGRLRDYGDAGGQGAGIFGSDGGGGMVALGLLGRSLPPAVRRRVLRPRSRCSNTRVASADFCSLDTKVSTSSNTWFRMSWGHREKGGS